MLVRKAGLSTLSAMQLEPVKQPYDQFVTQFFWPPTIPKPKHTYSLNLVAWKRDFLTHFMRSSFTLYRLSRIYTKAQHDVN